jgi:hypothetical protein
MDRLSAFIIVLAIGAATLLSGLVFGLGSRTIAYQQVRQGTIQHVLSANGDSYIQMVGNSSLYILHQDDFRPLVNANTLGDGDVISFIYDPSATTRIDVTSQLGTNLTGDASKIVQLTLFTANGSTSFLTPDYTQHPTGYTLNRWPTGGGLILLGLLVMSISLLLKPRRKSVPVVPQPAQPAQTVEQDATSHTISSPETHSTQQ